MEIFNYFISFYQHIGDIAEQSNVSLRVVY